MSTQVLPTTGISFPVTREVQWDTDIQQAISGKENRLSYYTYPRYQWTADIGFLSSSSVYSQTLQTLLGFVNQMQGQANSFLYQDPDDYSATAQTIGTGDGTTTAFQLVKSLGGFVEPVFAPNLSGTINVYINGTLQSSGNYTINAWGTNNTNGPGSLVFNTAPSSGAAITASFTFYYPCRFASDKFSFSLSYKNTYTLKKLAWISVKN